MNYSPSIIGSAIKHALDNPKTKDDMIKSFLDAGVELKIGDMLSTTANVPDEDTRTMVQRVEEYRKAIEDSKKDGPTYLRVSPELYEAVWAAAERERQLRVIGDFKSFPHDYTPFLGMNIVPINSEPDLMFQSRGMRGATVTKVDDKVYYSLDPEPVKDDFDIKNWWLKYMWRQ